VGHQFWSRDYLARAQAAEALFAGTLSDGAARALVTGSGARLLVADCAHPYDLASTLHGLVVAVRRFGCASVYVLAGSSGAGP
jgi:hypothetical protein